MTKEALIAYIRDYDPFFNDAHLEEYPYHELLLIKISIDTEKEKIKSELSEKDPSGLTKGMFPNTIG